MPNKNYNIEYFKNLSIDKGGECISDIYYNCRTKLEFKCSLGHVWTAEPRHIVEGRWCPTCGYQNGRRYDVDHEFFSRDTEESFYVAGFLAADGWKTRKGGGGYTIGLQLAAKDFDQLKRIHTLLSCTSPFKFREGCRCIAGNEKESITQSYTFVFNSERCYNDLERFGVVENKTYKLRFPEWLIDHPLVHHYMRGYIDGDGCFGLFESEKEKSHVYFCMKGTKELLEVFHNILLKNGVCQDNERRNKLTAKNGKKHPAFDTLRYSGNGVLSKMYDFIYKDATVFLPRKEIISKKACELAVYGGGTCARKTNFDAIPMTKDILLEKIYALKSGKKIAEHYGCTSANVSWWVKKFGIQDEYRSVLYIDKMRRMKCLIGLETW